MKKKLIHQQIIIPKISNTAFVLLMMANIIYADNILNFEDYKRKALAPYAAKFEKIKTTHKNDPQVAEFCEHVELIENVTTCLIDQFQTIRASSLNDLLDDIIIMSEEDASSEFHKSAMSAKEILTEYQMPFANELSLPSLVKAETETLRNYCSIAATLGSKYIANYGKIAADINETYAIDILELYLVMPFLYVVNQDWSEREIEILPEWMKTKKHLQTMEYFSLLLKRPWSAYCFALYNKQHHNDPNTFIDYGVYLAAMAKKLAQNSDFSASVYCFSLAIKLAEKAAQHDIVADLYFHRAKVLYSTGHFTPAAEHMKSILTSYPEFSYYAEVAMLRVKYLYEAGLYKEILQEAPGFREDNRCLAYLPQIIYISWLTSRDQNLPEQAEKLQEIFLKKFPEHILAKDMYFALAMAALSAGNYNESLHLLKIIEYRYPELPVVEKVKDIQEQIKKYL